jgi:hypothetical protein
MGSNVLTAVVCRNTWKIIACCLVVVIMWCGWRNAQSAAPTPKPDHTDILHQEIRGLVNMLEGSNLKDQKSAHGELVTLQKMLVDRLLDESNGPRNRHSEQARLLLRKLRVRTLAADTVATLPEPRRQKLLNLHEKLPSVLYQALSHDETQRLKVMRSIPEITPSEGLTEELVWIGLNDSSPSVVLAAVRSIQPGRHTSRHVVERLAYFIAAANNDEWGAVTDIVKKADGPLLLEAARKLESIGAKGIHVCPVLMSLCESDSGYTIVRDALVARTVAALAAKRAITMFIGRLKYTSGHEYMIYFDGRPMSVNCSRSDQFLVALLGITGQSIREYGLLPRPILPGNIEPDLRIYGFKDKKQRSAAYAKFRKWWAENSSKPE